MRQYWCRLQLRNKPPPNVTTSNKNTLLSLMVLCVDQFQVSGSDLGSLMQLHSDGSWDWSHLKTKTGLEVRDGSLTWLAIDAHAPVSWGCCPLGVCGCCFRHMAFPSGLGLVVCWIQLVV